MGWVMVPGWVWGQHLLGWQQAWQHLQHKELLQVRLQQLPPSHQQHYQHLTHLLLLHWQHWQQRSVTTTSSSSNGRPTPTKIPLLFCHAL